jgi:large subunit ribosomal protein L16
MPEIEATKRVLRRLLKNEAKNFSKVFPQLPITKKPESVRMGKGKGPVKFWYCNVQKSNLIIECVGINNQNLNKAINTARNKLSVTTRVFCSP